MIKLIWFIFKELIWGDDFTVDFGLTVSFEEALSYLRKGYFIHRLGDTGTLFVKIKDNIYCINTQKGTAIITDGFTSRAMKDLWKIVPEKMQTEKKFLDKDLI